MKKNLFGVDVNNYTDEASLLFTIETFNLSSECKKIDIDKWKKIN